MFRVNSISKQVVRLNVIEGGRPQLVDLLPKNFVFSEACTNQMKLLEKEGVIRVRAVKSKPAAAQIKSDDAGMEGKLDFVQDDASKVAKVQKKKK